MPRCKVTGREIIPAVPCLKFGREINRRFFLDFNTNYLILILIQEEMRAVEFFCLMSYRIFLSFS